MLDNLKTFILNTLSREELQELTHYLVENDICNKLMESGITPIIISQYEYYCLSQEQMNSENVAYIIEENDSVYMESMRIF